MNTFLSCLQKLLFVSQDYVEETERPREPPRRALLPLEGPQHLEHRDLLDEQVDYRRARPPPAAERDYVSRDYTRERRDDDYGDHRCVFW